MSRSLQFVFVLAVATILAVIGSHLLIDWTKIKTTVSEPLVFGEPNGRPPAFRAGSSLSDYDIDWKAIAGQTHTEILAWGVAGGSPYEFEQVQKKVPDACATYIVVSSYDMDEANVSDFRAALVPLSEAIKSLRAIHANWSYSKQAISEYPMTWLRTVFPTIGRSRAIMGLIHERIHNIFSHSVSAPETVGGPLLDVSKEKVADNYRLQKIEDWSKAELAGKVSAMRAGFQGSDAFDGQKFHSLLRMLQFGCDHGPTIVVVVPVSSEYSKEFMTPELTRQFEASLSDARQRYPKVEWLRLDNVHELESDANFCDLVHMNTSGQEMTTGMVQAWLKQSSPHS
jgi:hypothetical protein